MNAPQIWIFIPFMLSFVLLLTREKRIFSAIIAGGSCAFLSIFALTVKIGEIFPMGPATMEIGSTLTFFGRSFNLVDGDRYLIALLYGMGAVWFFGSIISVTNSEFVPGGLAIIALMIAAFSVEPFLYSALIIEMAVLISIPILIQPMKPLDIGLTRYLIFQTLAMPFILLAGWGFEQAAISSNSSQINIFAVIFLGFGFSLYLAVFPFYTWVPLLAESGHPYASGFIFATLPTAVQLILADFINTYTWLRNTTIINTAAQSMGIVMIVISGIWAAFHKSLLRLFGYLILVDIGFSLIAFSFNSQVGWHIYFSSIFPKLFSIAICALSLSILSSSQGKLHLDYMKGQFYSHPLSIIAFLTGWFSLSGIPLFPSFPNRLALLMELSETSIPLVLWSLAGVFGLLFASFRMISVFFSRNEDRNIVIHETPIQSIFLIIGILVLIIIGLFPNFYNNLFLPMMSVYENLS